MGKQKKESKAQFPIRLAVAIDATMLSDIKKIALQDDRSVNYIVRQALGRFISEKSLGRADAKA
jgi:hypothetical protein